jgi:hypothetical protein
MPGISGVPCSAAGGRPAVWVAPSDRAAAAGSLELPDRGLVGISVVAGRRILPAGVGTPDRIGRVRPDRYAGALTCRVCLDFG